MYARLTRNRFRIFGIAEEWRSRREAKAYAHDIAKKATRGPNSAVTVGPTSSRRKRRKMTEIRGPRALSQSSF